MSTAIRSVAAFEAASGTPRRYQSAHDEFFGVQPTSTSELPDPKLLLENLARSVIEVLAGARDLEQLAAWVDESVYRQLLRRVALSSRARQARKQSPIRPSITVGNARITEPRDGVIEAVVIVRSRTRARAIAIRLEGLDRRWRASAINVL